ncbi:MAG: hypothetical protein ACI4V1_01205 [Eubacteriales bacterium]
MRSWYLLFLVLAVVALCSSEIDRTVSKVLPNSKKRAALYAALGVTALAVLGLFWFRAAQVLLPVWQAVLLAVVPVTACAAGIAFGKYYAARRRK